jgi:hypothetical protein
VDALVTAVLQSAPSWGVGGLLITFIVVLMRREGSVAERHAAELDQRDKLHAAELERINADHDQELEELREKIRHLRADVNALDEALSAQREARLGLPPRRRRDELEARGGLRDPEPID